MDANDIVIFAAVVKAGSFVGASRALDIPKSTVSRRIAELEKHLGARLLQRTTRQLSLTDAGRVFHAHAERIVAEIEGAAESVGKLEVEPRGTLRVTAPVNFDHLAPAVTAFMCAYPKVRVEMLCTDRMVNLIEEGFDVAIRVGSLRDSSLIARRVGALKSLLVASPAYFEKRAKPSKPDHLRGLECLVFGGIRDGHRWTLVRDGKRTIVEVGHQLFVNDFNFIRAACLQGLGIASLGEHDCRADLQSGVLVRVLDDWSSPALPVHAVYPSTRYLAPKTNAFVEYLANAGLG